MPFIISVCNSRVAMVVISKSHDMKSHSNLHSKASAFDVTRWKLWMTMLMEMLMVMSAGFVAQTELVCCDACPSGNHLRCIGMVKMHIGQRYCLKCAVNKLGPAITPVTSLVGDIFGVDPCGQVLLVLAITYCSMYPAPSSYLEI